MLTFIMDSLFFFLIIQVSGPLTYSDYPTASNRNWRRRSWRPNGNHVKSAVVGARTREDGHPSRGSFTTKLRDPVCGFPISLINLSIKWKREEDLLVYVQTYGESSYSLTIFLLFVCFSIIFDVASRLFFVIFSMFTNKTVIQH